MSQSQSQSQYHLWQRKLRYLLNHHGCLQAVARATGLRPASLEKMASDRASSTETPQLESAAVRQIERDLDLPDGWFDASAFLPSSL